MVRGLHTGLAREILEAFFLSAAKITPAPTSRRQSTPGEWRQVQRRSQPKKGAERGRNSLQDRQSQRPYQRILNGVQFHQTTFRWWHKRRSVVSKAPLQHWEKIQIPRCCRRWRVNFARQAAVIKRVPRFLSGSFRIALKLAHEEISAGSVANDRVRQERGWKLFFVLPWMLLHRPPKGGLLVKDKMLDRFQKLSAGQWADIFRAIENCSVEDRRCRVQIWPFGTTATLKALRVPQKRSPRPREAIPEIPPHRPSELDEGSFCPNLRSAKKGAASGPFGMT